MVPLVTGEHRDTYTEHPRVLIIGSRLSGGGAETHVRLLAKHLVGGVADLAVLHPFPHDPFGDWGRVVSLGWTGKLSYVAAAYRLRRLLRTRNYDAAISLGLYPNVLLAGASRQLQARPALIMLEITRPVTSARSVAVGVNFVRQRLYRYSYARADVVAANSIDGITEISAAYGVEAVTRVPNLIEPQFVRDLARSATPVSTAEPARFCIVARLEPVKRIDTLLEAAAGLDPTLNWSIDVIGDGSQRSPLAAQALALRIGERVTFHGWQANPYPFVARATALVLCSELEGFSNSVLEAMVLGTPVVTSYCSSDARNMVSQNAALGYEVGDARQLRRHLAALVSNPQARAQLAASGMAFAQPHFVDEAKHVYDGLVANAIARREDERSHAIGSW